MDINIKPMSTSDAKEMIQWRYDGDYRMYNLTVDDIEEEAIYLTDPENHFYGIYSAGEFVGHAVFKGEACVPGGDYRVDALDIGVGMHPDWTGQGKGTSIIAYIIEFGRNTYKATKFRATIATWNLRAQKATQKNGFEITSKFKASNNDKEFVIMLREE